MSRPEQWEFCLTERRMIMNNKGIAIVGRIAEHTELLDGQTVKTRILYEELQLNFPDRKFVCVDTYQYRRHLPSILFRTVQAFCECEHVFVLLSRNGRKFFFPLLSFLNLFFHRRMYHDVIGGALPDEAEERPALRKQLKKFEINWVELSDMKNRLEQLGVNNVEVLPNFKRLRILDHVKPWAAGREPFVFTVFSRIIKTKGIETAAEAIAQVNSRFEKQRAVLHIYGPVAAEYEKEFQDVLKKYEGTVQYMGCIPYNQSVQVLSGSFMLLFPSVYPGEGMPGTIIDAFSAGLPVIASDWHFNCELVHDGVTGYCYDWRKPETLKDYIIYAIEHPDEINGMRSNCLQEAYHYTPDAAMKQICRRMEQMERQDE